MQLQLLKPDAKEVVLVTDQPWEGNTSGYYTVFQDGDVYRMIYRGWQHDAQKKAVHPEVTCYAESHDGIHWTKPDLGLCEWQGSKQNNIVWLGSGTHNFTAFRDDNPATLYSHEGAIILCAQPGAAQLSSGLVVAELWDSLKQQSRK